MDILAIALIIGINKITNDTSLEYAIDSEPEIELAVDSNMELAFAPKEV